MLREGSWEVQQRVKQCFKTVAISPTASGIVYAPLPVHLLVQYSVTSIQCCGLHPIEEMSLSHTVHQSSFCEYTIIYGSRNCVLTGWNIFVSKAVMTQKYTVYRICYTLYDFLSATDDIQVMQRGSDGISSVAESKSYSEYCIAYTVITALQSTIPKGIVLRSPFSSQVHNTSLDLLPMSPANEQQVTKYIGKNLEVLRCCYLVTIFFNYLPFVYMDVLRVNIVLKPYCLGLKLEPDGFYFYLIKGHQYILNPYCANQDS